MSRLHHASALLALAVLLISLSGTWFIVELPQGSTLLVSGLEVSAVASTLLGAAYASYGAALLVKGVPRRLLGALQGVLALGAFWAFTIATENPVAPVAAEISQLTGIAGSSALDGVTSLPQPIFTVLGFVGVGLVAFSGFAGLGAADSTLRQSRYERSAGSPDATDPVSTWDSLSEGFDPTKR
jgi:uncharacterized membrane protein (TIGR02234 family)